MTGLTFVQLYSGQSLTSTRVGQIQTFCERNLWRNFFEFWLEFDCLQFKVEQVFGRKKYGKKFKIEARLWFAINNRFQDQNARWLFIWIYEPITMWIKVIFKLSAIEFIVFLAINKSHWLLIELYIKSNIEWADVKKYPNK